VVATVYNVLLDAFMPLGSTVKAVAYQKTLKRLKKAVRPKGLGC
jgi:hypothetical protein